MVLILFVLLLVTFKLQQLFWTIITLMHLARDRLLYGSECSKPKSHQKPKCLEGWDDHFIQLEDIQLHYVQAGSDNKPLMLMLHGFPEFWYSWRFQLDYFFDKYRCIAVDQRGYNLSDKPRRVEAYHLNVLVNDILDLVQTLGYKTFILMGHGWGALVAWRFAILYPERVEKLIILSAPHPRILPVLIAVNPEQRRKSWYEDQWMMKNRDYHMLDVLLRGKRSGIRNTENFTDEDLEAWKYVFSQDDAFSGPLKYYRNIADLRLLEENDICEPPTLIIWGTEDHFLVKEAATASMSLRIP
ncbi:hydrolase, alpha/beta domain protein [Dictyocaulus viviparus]|uniref:Hydrolase, alpha/beta domain protein n=1 Tax=Dictyocaulus viviparus TaxID=29172 RepID=A0A0D8XUV8_DICVI|nr:hydrolase, alpha/beta domain protein [Dictyocaulus viviparus]